MSTTEERRRLRESIRREADRRGIAAFLVGGTVRDILRRRVPRDLDVAIEGDAVGFARAWGRQTGAVVEVSTAFGTATATIGGGRTARRVDFSSTREESYRHPGALPEVRPARIDADLARRDFTVNAMAIALSGARPGALLDPYGGKIDLHRGVIRMLHPRSPHDDPTRAYRAVRFAHRLGFRIDGATRRWIEEARDEGAFARVSGDRLRRELFLLFGEGAPAATAASLARLGLDRAIDPAFSLSASVRRRLATLERMPAKVRGDARAWAALFLCGLEPDPEQRRRIGSRLGLTGARKEEWMRWPDDLGKAKDLLARRGPLSELAVLARAWSPEEFLAVSAALPADGRERLRRARRKGEALRLTIRGEDLKRSGVRPGPGIGRALDSTWRARVDGRIGRSEELEFALDEASR